MGDSHILSSTAAAPAQVAAPALQAAPYWILRVGAALCFIGHGAFGFVTKAAWVPYFGLLGIGEPLAYRLMPLVGAIDVTVGMSVLFAPRRIAIGYMTVWALWTALLRPFTGESMFEAVERAGNYGVPLALLVYAGVAVNIREWFGSVSAERPSQSQLDLVRRILQFTTVLLLAGHGALGTLVGKTTLTEHYAEIGLAASMTPIVGWAELALAAAIAMRPAVGLLLLVVVWKLASESLFLVAGAPGWEFVERAGSYAAPLALAGLSWGAGIVPNRRPVPRDHRMNLI